MQLALDTLILVALIFISSVGLAIFGTLRLLKQKLDQVIDPLIEARKARASELAAALKKTGAQLHDLARRAREEQERKNREDARRN